MVCVNAQCSWDYLGLHVAISYGNLVSYNEISFFGVVSFVKIGVIKMMCRQGEGYKRR